ncbi:DUF1217 domain-containing protein [Rhodopseudomonas palustris]|uniref:DUF1217 domain-containing protein n=1 Tax=Rhodopseudomonas palustris (strain BisB18) TaxID=316056 RepID=Q215B1_RHOPB
MVSTYLSYDLVARNLKQSLTRVAKQTDVTREAAYYKDNIGKVKTVDDLLKNDRLYRYAMKAYGLEDMTFAKAFMRKVLESDLSDTKSFANKLTDKRYREFASAFSFTGGTTAAAQSSYQTDEMVGLYTATLQRQADAVGEDTRYYNAKIGSVTTVDQLLNDDRLRGYVFSAFGIDEDHWSRDTLRKVLSSDSSDPNSYVNAVWGPPLDDLIAKLDQAQLDSSDAKSKIVDYTTQLTQPGADLADLNAKIAEQRTRLGKTAADISSYTGSITAISHYFDLAGAFEFSPDGTLAAGVSAQTDASRKTTNERFITSQPRTSPSTALLEKQFFQQKIAGARTVDQLLAAPDAARVASFIGTAFGLGTLPLSTIKSILTSDRDPNNPNSYVNSAGSKKDAYTRLMKAFNFNQDGTLDAGVDAQSETQTATTVGYYMVAYNDADEASDKLAIQRFRNGVYSITSIEKFVSTPAVYNFALKSVGLDPDSVSAITVKAALESDLSNPRSYVYTLKDERYVQLARSFNFDSKGHLTTPLVAQDTAEVGNIAKDYVIAKTKFATAADKATLQKTAENDAVEYRSKIAGVDSVAELLSDKKLVNFILVAKGLDPKKVTPDTLKKILSSDLSDPKSFANTASDTRFAELAASFNFDKTGKVARFVVAGPQNREQLLETQTKYLQQSLEAQQGGANPGVRLALYFQRKAPDITSAYDILADKALSEVVRTTYNLPDSMANAPIEQQAKIVEKYLKLKDLSDPAQLAKILSRFSVMYDVKNASQNQSPALAILTGSGASISQDTFLAIARLGGRR